MADSGSFNSDDPLAVALASGDSVRQVATEAGIPVRTAFRLMNELSIRKHVQEVRCIALEEAISKLSAAGSKAVEAMLDLLTSDVPSSTPRAAARTVLEFGCRLWETNDFETRLCELEGKRDGKNSTAA